MAILKRFLCLCNTRTGSLVSGCYTLAISLMCMVYYLFRYVGHKLVEDSAEYKGIIYVGFVLYGFMIVSSLVIIPGVQLDKRYLLLPWIYIVILMVLYDTGSVALLTTVHLEREKTLQLWEIVWVFFYLFRLAANCYCFTCVVSQYQELSDGRGTYDYFYKPRRRTRYRSGHDDFYLDTFDLPFGVHLPKYTEEDATSLNPPSYDKIYPDTDHVTTSHNHQTTAYSDSDANNYAEIEINQEHVPDRLNDSGYIETSGLVAERGSEQSSSAINDNNDVNSYLLTRADMSDRRSGARGARRLGAIGYSPESVCLIPDCPACAIVLSGATPDVQNTQNQNFYTSPNSRTDNDQCYEMTVNIEWI